MAALTLAIEPTTQKTTNNSATDRGRKSPRIYRASDAHASGHLETPSKTPVLIGNGRDVIMEARNGQAISVDQTWTRALVQGHDTLAVAVGQYPLAEAAGLFALPVSVGTCPKSIAYGEDETAVAAGYSAEAHCLGKGGVAVAISTGCDGVVVSGGEGCVLVIIYLGKAFVAKVGENGIRANTPYTVNPNTGRWFEEERPYFDEHPPSQLTGLTTP